MAVSGRSSYNKCMQFEGQHEDEEVLFVFRHHIVKIRKAFYMLAIPFILCSIPVLVWPENLNNLWFAFGGLALGILLFFYQWIGWYFSMFIVTNQRLRQITQKGFFNRSVIDLGLSKIQNISYNIPGFSGAMFGFGTLVVQTYVGDLYLDKIEHPQKIYDQLTSVIKQYAKVGEAAHEKDVE